MAKGDKAISELLFYYRILLISVLSKSFENDFELACIVNKIINYFSSLLLTIGNHHQSVSDCDDNYKEVHDV